MGLPQAQPRYTIDQYLEMERAALDKHEYHDGEILAMSGGTSMHSLIILNVGGELRSRLKGKGCRAFDSNLRLRVPHSRRYVYPDVTVICGEIQLDPDDRGGETVVNPRVLVEVTSRSSESYDRGDKFDHYRLIPSLEAYVLVSQDAPRVEVFTRLSDDSWVFSVFTGLDAVAQLKPLGVELPLKEAYLEVTFPSAPA